MTDEEKKLQEELNTTIAEARRLNELAKKREAAGDSAVLAKEAADKALAEATKTANAMDELERKFLAQSARQVITSPEASHLGEIRNESVMLGQYFKTGQLTDASRKVMTLAMATDNTTGHYVIMPPTMATDILGLLRTFSPMEQNCDVQTIDGTVWEQVKVTAGPSAGRVSERGTRSETTTPTFGRDRIDTDGYYTYPTITQEQLYKTTDFDLGAFVESEGNIAVQALVEADYLTGNGIGGRPVGLLTDATLQAAAEVTVDADGLGASFDPMKTMTGNINEIFLPNARWMMKRSTEVAISLLKDGEGKYLWQPSLDARTPNMLFGYPVSYNGFMPAIIEYATNPYCVVFGDFSQGYKIIISRFMLLIRDEITSPGYVKLYKEVKKGGAVRRTESLALLKIAAS